MPIQLPTLDRTPVQSDFTMGQIKADVPDLSSITAKRGDIIQSDGNAAVDYLQKQEDQANDTKALEKSNQFASFINDQLEGPSGLRFQQGDPTSQFAQVSSSIDDQYKALLNDDSLSTRGKQILQNKLDNVRLRGNTKANTLYGSLYNKYQTTTTNDSIDLTKRSLVDAAQTIDPDDPRSYDAFDSAIQNIQDIRQNYGRKVGQTSMVMGPDGQPHEVMNAALQLATAKDLSDGVYKALNDIASTGNMDLFNAVKDKYGQYLDPLNDKKLNNSSRQAESRNKAADYVQDLQGMDAAKAFDEIDNDDDLSPQEKQLAHGYLNTYQRQKQQVNDRAGKTQFSALANYIQAKSDNGDAFDDSDEFMRDPYAIQVMNNSNMTPKQTTALKRMIDKPTNSNLDVKSDAYDALQNGDFKGMSFEDFHQTVSGLNAKDANFFENRWRDLNSQTPSQQAQMSSNMDRELNKQLELYGLVKKNDYGKLDRPNEMKMLQMRDDMQNELNRLPNKTMTPNEQQDFVKQYVVAKKKGEVFQPVDRSIPAPTPTPGVPTQIQMPTATPPPLPSGIPGGTAAGMQKLQNIRDFRAAHNGSRPADDGELNTWLQSRNK